MNYAGEGVDGINVHGGLLASNYNYYTPFVITASGGTFSLNNSPNPATTPLYYGMLFSAKGISGSNTVMYPVTLSTSAAVHAWATVDGSGVQRMIVVNRDTTTSGNVIVTNAASTASVCYLSAPLLSSVSGLKIFANAAGTTYQSFDTSTTGAPSGTVGFDVLTPSGGQFTFPMTTAQAAIVKFGSSSGC
jgi:hypothetical protein